MITEVILKTEISAILVSREVAAANTNCNNKTEKNKNVNENNWQHTFD
jgi:hypothetical protein